MRGDDLGTILPLWYDTFGEPQPRSYYRGVVFSTPRYDKRSRVVVLLREYKNVSNLSLQIRTMSLSNIDGMKCKLITPHKYKLVLRTLEIGVQRSLMLPTQVSTCHLM
jgi:hypothetical protein